MAKNFSILKDNLIQQVRIGYFYSQIMGNFIIFSGHLVYAAERILKICLSNLPLQNHLWRW